MEEAGNTCSKPLYSCGSEKPRRSLQCDFWAGKVKAKTVISTNFFGFYAIFVVFCRYLQGFADLDRVSHSQNAGNATPPASRCGRFKAGISECVWAYSSPKSTFLRGEAAATMGVFNASTTGAASRKWRTSVAAKLASSATVAGRVVANPHWRH